METPRFFIGDVGISAVNMKETLELIDARIRTGRSAYICACNVRTTVLASTNWRFRRILNESFLTVPDGVPLVWCAKLAGIQNVERVSGPGLMREVLSTTSSRGYTHYFYGSTHDVLMKMKKYFLDQFHNLDIRGMVSPPFRPLTNEEKIDTWKAINRARPTFVWVGLGAPKQEFWMQDIVDKINSSILIGVGAAFPFAAGKIKRPPQFVRSIGMEWLFRWIQQPAKIPPSIFRFAYFSIILFPQCILRARGKSVLLSKKEL